MRFVDNADHHDVIQGKFLSRLIMKNPRRFGIRQHVFRIRIDLQTVQDRKLLRPDTRQRRQRRQQHGRDDQQPDDELWSVQGKCYNFLGQMGMHGRIIPLRSQPGISRAGIPTQWTQHKNRPQSPRSLYKSTAWKSIFRRGSQAQI